MMRNPGPGHPWQVPARHALLTPSEIRTLTGVYLGEFGDGPWLVYSNDEQHRPARRMLRALHDLHMIELMENEPGWTPTMWGARLTCVGANTVFRAANNAHPGCPGDGHWLPTGDCTGCRARRPLDMDAYRDMINTMGAAAEQ